MDPRLKQIEEETRLLKDTMDTFHDIVLHQAPALNSIEDMIVASKQDAKQANQEIVVADTYQTGYRYTMAAVGSAVIGVVTLLLLL